MRPLTRLAALLVLLLLVPAWAAAGVPVPGIDPPADAAPGGRVIPADLPTAPDQVPLTADGQLPLVVEARGGTAAVAARVAELGGRIQYTFTTIPALAVTVPPARVHELVGDPQVLMVERQKFVRRAVSTIELPGGVRVEGGMVRDTRLAAETVPIPREEIGRATGGGVELETFLGYDALIGASEVWAEADYGEGTIVVVVDTGIYPAHPLILESVIGGQSLVPFEEEEAIDLDGDGQPDGRSFDWNAIQNHDHGTFVSGLIAGHAELLIPRDARLARSLFVHSPESIDSVDATTARVSLMGMAPAASLYAIKVFPYDGGDAPDARVAEALDRVIAMKRSGELATDIVNLSLGGPTLWDGHGAVDRLVDAAVAEGITVVAAAGNEGPALTTTGSPANAFRALTAGAAVDPLHTRVGFEQLFQQAPIGTGSLLYPYDALQVASFSSRGQTADGRVKPDVLATGLLNFSSALYDLDQDGLNDAPGYGFGAGTSFAAPTVAGSAALLAAYGRSIGGFSTAPFLSNILLRTAGPIAPGERLAEVEQGKGFVRLPAAVAMLESGHGWNSPPRSTRNAGVTYLNAGDHGTAEGRSRELGPGETHTFAIRVPRSVKEVEVSFPEVTLGGDQNPLFGDHLEVHVHSAKRGGNGDYLFADMDVNPFAGFTLHLPEPGEVRITFAGTLVNWDRVAGSFTLRTRSGPLPGVQVHEGPIVHDGTWETTFEVPADLAGLELWLSWPHNWTAFPTYDLDFIAFAPDGTPHLGGVSLRSPERTMIFRPEPGTWRIRALDMGTVDGHEWVRLHAKTYRWFDPDVSHLTLADEEPADAAAKADAAATAAGRPGLALLGVTPNPLATSASVRFELGAATAARVAIFDAGGRRVRTLADRPFPSGVHAAVWDGRDENGAQVASGVYFARIETAAGTATRKLVVAR